MGKSMENRLKTRFDYDKPETCFLAMNYILETQKCPECMRTITIRSWIEDNDFLIVQAQCSKCKFTLEYGSVLDDSQEANDLKILYGVKK